MKFPIYIPEITDEEKKMVNDCLDSTWISSRGKYIEMFEDNISKYVGSKYAVAVSNGTVALHLALVSHNIGFGDEVIIPDLTYIATANSVLYVNAKPIFADVDPETWNISPKTIIDKITPNTKAIIVADLYGTPVEINEIKHIAQKNNIVLIEDAAESLGATHHNMKAGNLADIGTLSFFGNKTVTTGEGGMVITNDYEKYKLLKKLRNQGNSDSIRYYHDILGFNYRMTNIQAAIGVAQMSRIDNTLLRKRNIQKWYEEELKSCVTFQKIPDEINSSYWIVSILLETEKIRDDLMIYLEKKGVETRPFFKPMSSMPYFKKCNNRIAYRLSELGLSLPSYPSLKKENIKFICTLIKNNINKDD